MAGRLGEWSVEDLLQIAKITQKTTSIEVVGEGRSGVIYLRDGGVVHAELVGAVTPAGDRFSRIVEVISALASIRDGSFEFGNRDVPPDDERPVDVKALFAAMEKDVAREKRLADLGIAGVEGLGVVRHLSDPLTLKPAAWQLISDLVMPFSLVDLERRLGRRRAVAAILTLEALGVLARGVELPPSPAVETPPTPEPVIDPQEQEVAAAEPAPPEGASAEAWERAGLGEPGPPIPPDPGPETYDAPEAYDGEPIVEVFGVAPPPREMHEVVAPSEMTLVSDVLGDLRSRFRSGSGQTLDPGYED